MIKKLLACTSLLALFSVGAQAQDIPNPGTLVFLWTDGVTSLDPAYVGNTPSTYASLNIYSRLLNYDGENTSNFVPALSSEVPSIENGLIKVNDDQSVEYVFPIRKGVHAHKVGVAAADGSVEWLYYDDLTDEQKAAIKPGYGEITPEDVKYSLMRAMMQGESWMSNAITEMITAGEYPNIAVWAAKLAGVDKLDEVDAAGLANVYEALSEKIAIDDDAVTIKLAKPFPATLGVIALPYGTSIVDKEWAVAQGDWSGDADTWIDFYKPDTGADPLFKAENGTGPFMLEEWDQGERKLVLKRFENYMFDPAPLERVVLRNVPEWTTRRLQLEAGDADVVATPVEFLDEMKKTDGVTVTEGLPQIYGRSLFFMWPITSDSSAIGSGKLDGKGIPPDFFGDIDVRKGFNFAQDYDLLIEQVNLNKTVQLRGPTVRGLMGYRSDSPVYKYDPKKAEEHFRKAFGGKLWDVGFELTAFHTEGSSLANAALSVLQQNLARINPKFRLNIQAVPWSALSDRIYGQQNPSAPMAYMGWGPDYSDPGGPLGAATYYLSSTGLVAGFSGDGYRQLMRDHFDALLDEAWNLTDPAEREPLYAKLQEMSYEYATTQFLWEEYSYIVTRDWINGYVHNMVTYGAWDFYNITKGE